MKKSIAFHIPSLGGGGAERVVCNLANYFAGKDYQVFIITSQMEDKPYFTLDERVKRVVLPTPQGCRVMKIFRRLRILRQAFVETGDSVVVSFIGMANLRAILATRFSKMKVIVSVRSAPAREYAGKEKLAKFLFQFADGAVFQTQMAQDYFPKSVRSKSVILMNPLLGDFSRPRYEGDRAKEVVTVGRLHSVKNHELLIRAFYKLHDRYPDYVLRIYGDGDHREALERLIAQLQAESFMFLEGNCDKVADAIWKSTLFVLSSDTEGMPNALLEAMALGLPCISTDCPCGGPRMLIQDGINGRLIPVKEEHALTAAIESLLADPAGAARMGREAQKVRERYAPDKIYAQWEQYIMECVKC